MFSIWLALIMVFSFVEAFILPLLAAESPAFVAGFLGVFTGIAGEIDLGILPTLWQVSGPLFIVGPLLFAIATFRAGVLPRGAAGLQALGAVLIPAGAFLPPTLAAPPGARNLWLAGVGDRFVDEPVDTLGTGWLGRTTIDRRAAEQCSPTEWLLLGVWDES